MKRSAVITLILGAALVLIPVIELRAQQRRNDTRGFRSSRFSGYQRSESGPASGAAAYGSYAEPQRPGKPLPGDYEVLISKSIFDKDRRARSSFAEDAERNANSRPAPTYVKAPSIPVLIGVILGDDDYIAYIEDPDTSKLWPFVAGDTLPGDYGTVRQVGIDAIEITKDSSATTQRILIGENLKGEVATLPPLPETSSISSTPSSSSSTPSSITPATLPAGTGDMTLEQRMKLRRQQQMGQQ